MSYITWRKENEEKYCEIANDGALETMPAFRISSTCDLSDDVVGPITDQMANNPKMNMIHFAAIFAEYLYETYNISPVDVEIFTQYIIKAYLKQVVDNATESGKLLAKMIQEMQEDEGEES